MEVCTTGQRGPTGQVRLCVPVGHVKGMLQEPAQRQGQVRVRQLRTGQGLQHARWGNLQTLSQVDCQHKKWGTLVPSQALICCPESHH